MDSMCAEAAGEPGYQMNRRFKGRCVSRRNTGRSRTVVLRPEASTDLNDMLHAIGDDVEYVERDVRRGLVVRCHLPSPPIGFML